MSPRDVSKGHAGDDLPMEEIEKVIRSELALRTFFWFMAVAKRVASEGEPKSMLDLRCAKK